MPTHSSWELYGADLPGLPHVASRVLSRRPSTCGVVCLWSWFGLVWSDSRASLGAKKAVDLIKADANLLMIDYEVIIRSCSTEPDGSDSGSDSEDNSNDGARAVGMHD